MIGPEERRKPQRFGGLRDRQLVGVTGTLLRFNEYPKVHERQTMPSCAAPPRAGSLRASLQRGVTSDEYRLEPESV